MSATGPPLRRGVLYWIFQRPKFCCCLPVRVCVIITSALVFLVASLLSIVLWFEVANTSKYMASQRGALIGAGFVESLLAVVGAIGFIGAVIHKQTFVNTYCIGLWVHFLINLGVALYFLIMIFGTSGKDGLVACEGAISNPAAQQQCLSLLHLVTDIVAGAASVVLVLEIYSAIVATRLVFAVREIKRVSRLPPHERAALSAGKTTLVPSFVRYTDAEGNTVYDSHYYPPSAKPSTTHQKNSKHVSRDSSYAPLVGHEDEMMDEEEEGGEMWYDPAPAEHNEAYRMPHSEGATLDGGVGTLGTPTPTAAAFATPTPTQDTFRKSGIPAGARIPATPELSS